MTTTLAPKGELSTASQLRKTLTKLIYMMAMEICHPIYIQKNIIHLLSDVIIESLLYRKEEWIRRGVDPSETTSDEIIKVLRSSLSILLSEAKLNAKNDNREYLLQIDILVGIHGPWCKIFPFCRG
jgi:hypothetical protein